jgi:hypothetical protein
MSLLLVAAAAMQLVFDATADDRRLGQHRYDITEDAAGVHLTGDVDFRVTILRVPVFRYRHHVTELWRDGCLVELHSTTKSQGDEWSVEGRIEDGTFVVARTFNDKREHETLDACTASFAYWDPELLIGRAKLLNGQTGVYEPLTVNVTEGDETNPRHIRLTSAKFTIDLDYRDGRWVRLESQAEGGQHVVYKAAKDD